MTGSILEDLIEYYAKKEGYVYRLTGKKPDRALTMRARKILEYLEEEPMTVVELRKKYPFEVGDGAIQVEVEYLIEECELVEKV